jgi:hypothetical protein
MCRKFMMNIAGKVLGIIKNIEIVSIIICHKVF